MQDDTRPARPLDKAMPDQKQPRFLDSEQPRRVPLGRLRTDEESRLAAEIEKLRG